MIGSVFGSDVNKAWRVKAKTQAKALGLKARPRPRPQKVGLKARPRLRPGSRPMLETFLRKTIISLFKCPDF